MRKLEKRNIFFLLFFLFEISNLNAEEINKDRLYLKDRFELNIRYFRARLATPSHFFTYFSTIPVCRFDGLNNATGCKEMDKGRL